MSGFARLGVARQFACFMVGLLLVTPFEVYRGGVYSGYLVFILLITLGASVRAEVFAIALVYSMLVLFSTLVSTDISITSLINPLVAIFYLVLNAPRRICYNSLAIGMSTSIIFQFFIFVYLFVFVYSGDFVTLLTIDRLWASDVLAFNGNSLAIILILASFFLLTLNYKLLASLSALASIFTTSRLAMIGVLTVFLSRLIGTRFFLLCLLACGFAVAPYIIDSIDNIASDPLYQRIVKAEDRRIVLRESLLMISSSPWIGSGPIAFGTYEHAHNAFLHIWVRYGFFALFLFVVVLILKIRQLPLNRSTFFFLFFMSSSSITQLGLLHPNVMGLFIIYIWYISSLHTRLVSGPTKLEAA